VGPDQVQNTDTNSLFHFLSFLIKSAIYASAGDGCPVVSPSPEGPVGPHEVQVLRTAAHREDGRDGGGVGGPLFGRDGRVVMAAQVELDVWNLDKATGEVSG
jgi:hypothetical protein